MSEFGNETISRKQKLVLSNLCPAPLLGNHVDGLRVQDWLGIGAAWDDDGDNDEKDKRMIVNLTDGSGEGRGGSITDTKSEVGK